MRRKVLDEEDGGLGVDFIDLINLLLPCTGNTNGNSITSSTITNTTTTISRTLPFNNCSC